MTARSDWHCGVAEHLLTFPHMLEHNTFDANVHLIINFTMRQYESARSEINFIADLGVPVDAAAAHETAIISNDAIMPDAAPNVKRIEIADDDMIMQADARS